MVTMLKNDSSSDRSCAQSQSRSDHWGLATAIRWSRVINIGKIKLSRIYGRMISTSSDYFVPSNILIVKTGVALDLHNVEPALDLLHHHKKQINPQSVFTHAPSDQTLTDFVRMIWEKRVDKVVMLTNLLEEGKRWCGATGTFIDDATGQSSELRPSTRTLTPTLCSCRRDLLTQLPLPSTVTYFWRLVTQFNVGLVIAFDLDSRNSDKSTRNNQTLTLLMCKSTDLQPGNGADHCGMMCVQSILLDRLEADQCLTVPLVVGGIKAVRPQVIPTLDQYKCLYSVLKLAHESQNVYGNVGDMSRPS
ncbi:hypothetical protein RRG08_056933 [Elysia crispata]|uniref:Tyrosine-protein phosphatase domain-containing protein n=1 Tax=Elysia crispata TaxID=231223 RepID=A0AAE0Z6C6_9GAST|nr:hypothetical protein RRG08_056933 [Elysia crispata]